MRVWRVFFAFTALCNFAVGGALVAASGPVAAHLGVSGLGSAYLVGLAGLLIAMFGLAYAVVAWDPPRNRNLVVIGAIGKASAAVLASFHALAHHIPDDVFLLGAGDLVLALLFAVYLRQTRTAA